VTTPATLGAGLPSSPRLLATSPFRRPWYAEVTRFPENRERYLRWKRILEVAFVLTVLPIIVPLLCLCCAAIVLDSPGSPVFTQHRTGTGGRRFRMIKLRTMVRDAEEQKSRLGDLNELTWPDFKIADDPRITRVGRFLRKTSLDELPQVFNVLHGSMSIVGPRPTSFSSSTYDSWQTARLDVCSGLTGLWQVEGRNGLDFDERVRLDIAYGRYCSLWLDLQIILRTVPCVFNARGAN
jgi:lipopolysaccharide/colanic/teichoic acid biosynthesis glycosyltransferase